MKKVSVVILNWNGAEMLRRFLPSVVRYSSGSDVEVCVADNASADESRAVVKKEFPSVRLICLDRNYGFADGYNKALEQVEARYAVLLNSDVEVTEGWLDTLVDYMDAHPDVAACQPKLLSFRDRKRFEYAGAAGGFIDRYGYPFCRGRIFDVVETDEGQYDTPVSVFWATGAALLVRLDIYRSAGGLDGRFFAHMEEIDLCWRLRSRGYSLVCVPASVVYHVGGATLKKENPRKTYLNFRNNLLMLYKNLPEAELDHVLSVRKVLDYLAAVSFLLKGERANFKAVLKARRDFRQMLPSFVADRKENLLKSVTDNIPERFRFSVLWRSKAKRKKTFSRLFGR